MGRGLPWVSERAQLHRHLPEGLPASRTWETVIHVPAT